MDNAVLKTSADDLYELVKSREKISIEEAAKLLKMPASTIQALVDFLVEDGIFGIEYKFTTPYIYISHKKVRKVDVKTSFPKKPITKEEFFQKAGKWNISPEKIKDLWKKYIEENIVSIKEYFYIKAHSRNIQKEKIDSLWKQYLTYLQ